MFDTVAIASPVTPETLIHSLNAAGIGMRRVRLAEKGCTFFVSGKDFPAFCALMRQNGKEYTVVNDNSFHAKFYKNIGRFGLYAGLIFAIVLTVFYSMSVRRIEIGGNSLVSTQTILEAVEKLTPLPTNRGDIDRRQLEKSIISLEGITAASVEVRGNTLLINVYEELDKAEIFDKTDYRDVVSLYDAVITRMVTHSGSALVKNGDTVRKGQVLISSDIQLDEELTAKERAFGEIYGRVWVTKSIVYEPTVLTQRRTGRTETVFSAFGVHKKYRGDFALYETETELVAVGGGVPLTLIKTVYYEMKEQAVDFDFFADEENIVKCATQKFEEELPEGAEKLRTWHFVKRLDKTVVLEIYYELETKIH